MTEMTRKTLYILSWVHSLLLFEGVYLMVGAVLDMDGHGGSSYPLQGLWLILPVVISFLCMHKIRNLWLYLVIGVGMTALMWSITGMPLTGIVTAFIFLVRCYARVVRGRVIREAREMPGGSDALKIPELRDVRIFIDNPAVWQWIVFAVFYVIIIATKQAAYLKPMFWVFLIEVFVCFAYCYLENQYAFIEDNQKIANLPVQTIRQVGKAVFVVMIALLAVFVLPSVIYGKEPLANIQMKEHHLEQTEQTARPADNMENILSDLRDDAKPAPPWLIGLLRVAWILLEVFIALVVVFLAIRFVRYLMRSYETSEEDQVIDLRKEKEDQISRVRGQRKQRERFWSPNQKIRRIYKKTIEKHIKEKPKGTETPEELELAAQLAEADGAFHALYEKARYSQEGCTAQEASGYQR